MIRTQLAQCGGVVGLLAVLCAPGRAQVTQRVSISSSGVQGNSPSSDIDFPSISSGGRYVAFVSRATNLVSGDTNAQTDIFVRDRELGTTERVSIDSGGMQGNGDSVSPSISSDGRYVAFRSSSNNLVSGDTNSKVDIFVRDRLLGTTERVSVDSAGVQGNGNSEDPSISADGRYVAFDSDATNLVANDTNGAIDIFVRDRQLGTTERVSLDSAGLEAGAHCYNPSISSDGRYVAFYTLAPLVANDLNGFEDVFLRDRQLGTTERVSVDSSGLEANGHSESTPIPAMSADGRYVVFWSSAANLVAGDTNGTLDVFVRDRQLSTTERASVDSGGLGGSGNSIYPSISSDGRYVAFFSQVTTLVPGDTNAVGDIFVRDRQLSNTERISVDSAGMQGNDETRYSSMSPEGRFVAFASPASNLVANDTNGVDDVFVHDRDATIFVALCEPGVGGVMTCPCGNPPTGPGRGCNNFAPASGTGGASLTGSGFPSLAADTVSLDVSNTLKQIHVLFVGTALSANVRTGAGIRCVGGGLNPGGQNFLKRIAKQTPTNGPPSTMSFAGIEAASVAKGAPPIAGETYYYYAAYRNSAANGQPGCPGLTFGFNATNAGSVTWYP